MHPVWTIILILMAAALVVAAHIKFSRLRRHADDWRKIVKE